MPFQITNGNDLVANSGNFSYLTVNGIPVSTGVTSGGSNLIISNYGSGRVLLSDGTSSGIIAQTGLTFSSNILSVTGMPVSLSGHTHTSSNITDFNSSVSGLLPVTNIVGISGASVTSSGTTYTVAVTGSFGLDSAGVQTLLNNGVSINITNGTGVFNDLSVGTFNVNSGHLTNVNTMHYLFLWSNFR